MDPIRHQTHVAMPAVPAARVPVPAAPLDRFTPSAPSAATLPSPPNAASDRAKWVKIAFEDANRDLAQANPGGLQLKIDKMAANPFSYFRGAATLFYLDLAQHSPPPKDEPRLRLAGDVHPENFGTYQSPTGHLVYDLNDFDETARSGPFSWDVRRGVTGWMLAAQEAGHGAKHQEAIGAAFLDGFLQQTKEFAEHGGEKHFVVNLDHSDGPVHELLKKQSQLPPGEWLKKVTEKTADSHAHFVNSAGLHRRPDLEQTLEQKLGILRPQTIDDVAAKTDAGTASLGLPRYEVLVDGGTGHRVDDHVVEVKQEVRSALEGVPYVDAGSSADRAADVAHAAETLPAEPYPELGWIAVPPSALDAVPPLEGGAASFLVRQRPGVKAAVAETTLDSAGMESVARTQGRLLAAEMARQRIGDEAGAKVLHAYLKAHPDFAQTVLADSAGSAERINQDWKAFDADLGRTPAPAPQPRGA